MKFHSAYHVIGRMPPFPEETIREERNVFWATPQAAALHGGPVTQAFVEQLPAAWRNDPAVGIRTKLAWLRRGWYPLAGLCGWHCDMVSPLSHGRGQDYAATSEEIRNSDTLFAVVGDVSQTECVRGSFETPDYGGEQPQRILLNQQIERLIAAGKLESFNLEPDAVMSMRFGAFHRAAPAHREGWRIFLRAFRNYPKREREADAWTTMSNQFRPQTESEIMAFQPYNRGDY